jgi:putative phosphoribosyl transferase
MIIKSRTDEVIIDLESIQLPGNLSIPVNATGIIVFSHGSGSSRHSPRNKSVASFLKTRGFATLLFDLLTPQEDLYYNNRFNIALLTERLVQVTSWLQKESQTKGYKIGYFGSSTGAASALAASAITGDSVKAVVSRGGRPDLAMPYLSEVKAATLLMVGGLDHAVIKLNEEAYENLGTEEKQLTIIPDATHLFEEPGKLEEVSSIASEWFTRHLR